MPSDHRLSVDLTRVISALAIILIHTVAGSYFLIGTIGYKNWILSSALGWLAIWGTPVFIMLSGYLLIGSSRVKNYPDFLARRANKILIPLLFWNIFYYLFDHGFSGGTFNDFVYQLIHAGTHSHLYFLNAMAGLYALTPLLSKVAKKANLTIVVPVLVLLSAVYHFSYSFLGTPQLDTLFTLFIPYLGYYLAGFWIGNMKKIKYGALKSILAFSSLVLSIFITRKLAFIFATNDQDTILVSRLSLPVAATAIMVFYNLISVTNKTLKSFSFLPNLSALSLGVYLIHPFWLELFKLFPIYSHLMVSNYWVWFSGLFVLTTVVSFVSVYLLKKIPLLNRVV